MTTLDEIIDSIRRELRELERYGSRFYPCAVALTNDVKGVVLMAATADQSGYVRFSESGNMTIMGLAVAVVPDAWEGPLVLIGVRS